MCIADRHAPRELEIFREFASICGLSILPDSIEKQCPPEPDILCMLDGDKSIAFEMGELVDEDRIGKLLGDQKELDDDFQEYCRKLPAAKRNELQRRIGNAAIHVKMQRSKSLRSRKNAVPEIIEQLLDVDPKFEGDFHLDSKLKRIASVKIVRSKGNRQRPLFNVEATSFYNPIPLDSLQKKFEKTYNSPSPIELLTYYDKQDKPLEFDLRYLYDFIEEQIGSSCFRRVWVFDVKSKKVCYQTMLGE